MAPAATPAPAGEQPISRLDLHNHKTGDPLEPGFKPPPGASATKGLEELEGEPIKPGESLFRG